MRASLGPRAGKGENVSKRSNAQEEEKAEFREEAEGTSSNQSNAFGRWVFERESAEEISQAIFSLLHNLIKEKDAQRDSGRMCVVRELLGSYVRESVEDGRYDGAWLFNECVKIG